VVGFTASYVEIFFGLQTILLPILPDSIIPPDARRIQEKGHEQFHTLYILDSLLVKRIPTDGIVLMAITAKDLYPGKQWNYVFGQANLKKRVGVSSLSRLYDWPLTATNYQLFLRRIIKTATHEIGHMFTITHCIHAQCLMNGSNSLEEADQHPTYLCSECLKKLYWNWQFDPVERNQGLIQFFETHHMAEEMEHYQLASSYLTE
jgi:archaemetzincin